MNTNTGQRQLRVGLVGCGRIAFEHIRGFQAAGCRISALADSRLENAEGLRERFELSNVNIYAGHQEMARGEELDIISVLTPDFLHFSIVRDLFSLSHSDILCEKPLALRLEESRELAALAREKPIVTGMRFPCRYYPVFRHAKTLFAAGSIGEVYGVRAHFSVERLSDPDLPLEWRMSQKLGGYGVLSDLGSHIVDLLDFFFAGGAEPESSGGLWKTFHTKRRDPLDGKMIEVDAPELVIAAGKLVSGAVFNIECSRLAPGDQFFQIDGTNGSLCVSGGKLYIHERKPTDHQRPASVMREIPESEFSSDDRKDLFLEFADSCRNRTPFSPSFNHGADAIRRIDSIFNTLRKS